MAMKKIHILILVVLGIFLMPVSTFACGSHSENHSCKKEMTSKTEKKDCCGKNDSSKKECGGKCGHSKCGCSASGNLFAVTSEFHAANHTFDFSYGKQKFSTSETFVSSGFHSLWLIPKIS